MKLPLRYTYTLTQTLPGLVCVLTVDVQALAIATNGQPYGNTVQSNELHDPAELAKVGSYEPGAQITRHDNWTNTLLLVQDLAELYPGLTDDEMRQIGFGGDLDRAQAIRERLKLRPDEHSLTFTPHDNPPEAFTVHGKTFGQAVAALIAELEARFNVVPPQLWSVLADIDADGEATSGYSDFSDPEGAFTVAHEIAE